MPDAPPCRYCGDARAPYGYRPKGELRDIPPARRACLWACERAECQQKAREEARR